MIASALRAEVIEINFEFGFVARPLSQVIFGELRIHRNRLRQIGPLERATVNGRIFDEDFI